jgi:hypothetical protein
MSNDLVVGKAFDGHTARMHGRPERIFISVNESTGRSTISFQPADVGPPVLHEDDHTGAVAMREAKAISDRYAGCTIHGPHFHAARPPGRKRMMRKPSNNGNG